MLQNCVDMLHVKIYVQNDPIACRRHNYLVYMNHRYVTNCGEKSASKEVIS